MKTLFGTNGRTTGLPKRAGVALLVAASLLAGSVLSHQTATAALGKDRGRAFYLSENKAFGADALFACAAGFHMASVSEILDPSNLTYDTDLGYGPSTYDAGSGIPANVNGWVRTGYPSALDFNCGNWTSGSGFDRGTVLAFDWANPMVTPISPWVAGSGSIGCGSDVRVWCVQD